MENNDKLIADLKDQIIQALNLRNITAADIGTDQPLFVEGLGLDSIDALELIVLMQQNYQLKITDPKLGPEIFRTVRSMAEYIQANQTH